MSSQAGISYFDGRPVPEAVVASVLSALGKTDVDAHGEFRAPGIFMAHAATWFDELGKMEKQPVASVRGNVLTFDGRLDNRAELLGRPREQRADARTDAVLALSVFEECGADGFYDLIGDWSLAVWEPADRRLTLASDYAGMRPIYYHSNAERVVWATSLQSLVTLSGATELEDTYIAGFLMRVRPPDRTPFRGILSVPAGCTIAFSKAGIVIRAFWKLPVRAVISYDDDREYEEHLRSLFRESMQARLRTSFPVFMELSGGWDSSSNVCVGSALIAGRVVEARELTTLSYAIPGGVDEKYAALVREFSGADGVTVDMKRFPHFDRTQFDDAIPNAAGAMYDELARQAKAAGARTYVSGQSGDIVMGNLPEDCDQVAGPLRRGQFATAWSDAIAWSIASHLPVWTVLWHGARACLPPRWRSAASYAWEGPGFTLKERRGDWLTASFKRATGMGNLDAFVRLDWQHAPPEKRRNLRLISRQLETRGYYGPPERLQHLYYIDPFLHRPLVEFVLAIPPDQLCRPGEPRRLMRRAFAQWVPPALATRQTKGDVMTPFTAALRNAATELRRETRSLRLIERGYVDGSIVNEQLALCSEGRPCRLSQLAQVVALELWMRQREGRAERAQSV